jgi:hypothetical protein
VGQLFDVHQRMMIAQQRQRSYPVKLELGKADPDAILTAYLHIEALTKRVAEADDVLHQIAVMMSEFVDNWPQPKRIDTAIALIAKTMRAALNPPKHVSWGAGEPDCPRDIKAGNGELHTLRCKVCGEDNPRDERCFAALSNAARGEEI